LARRRSTKSTELLADGNDLTIDHCLVWKPFERPRDGRESFAEILSIARGEMRATLLLIPIPR
jgi:hypothetical protein